MFSSRHELMRMAEERRRAREEERLQAERAAVLEQQGAEQLGLQRRAQDLGERRHQAELAEQRRVAEEQQRQAAFDEFSAARLKGDQAATEIAAKRLNRVPGLSAEYTPPFQAPTVSFNPKVPGAEKLYREHEPQRSRAAAQRVAERLSPGERARLGEAEPVTLTPSEGPTEPAERAGFWSIKEGEPQQGDVVDPWAKPERVTRLSDEKITGWQQDAIRGAFAKHLEEPNPELKRAAEKGLGVAMSELGTTKSVDQAINRGLDEYNKEAARIAGIERAKIAANRPRAERQDLSKNRTWDNLKELRAQINQEEKIPETLKTKRAIQEGLRLIKNRSGLKDRVLTKRLVEMTEPGGRMTDKDVEFILGSTGVIDRLITFAKQFSDKGLAADDYIAQVEDVLIEGMKTVRQNELSAGLKYHDEVMGSQLLEFNSESIRREEADRGFMRYYGVSWGAYQRWLSSQGGRGGATAPRPRSAATPPKTKAPAAPPKTAPKTEAPEPGSIKARLNDALNRLSQ